LKKRGKQFRSCNVKLVHGGEEYFTLLKQLIENAKHTIHLQTYIFSEDQTGWEIAEALINAASRKVQVYMLIDGYASQNLSRALINKLTERGVHFRFFEPLLKSNHFYFGRRLHHKVIAIDGEVALVGGINIADRYNDIDGERAWLDMAVMVNGQTAANLFRICTQLWTKPVLWPFQPVKALPQNAVNRGGNCLVRICRNDWVKGREEIWRSYYRLFKNARQSITIMCSYFLPGSIFRRQLKLAIRRGVKVKVILAGLSDVKLAKHAERYLYRWMLRNKIEIYEYQPAVLHAKMAVADERLFTIGSYNINDISAYASIELNLEIKSKEFVQRVNGEMEEIIRNDCMQIDPHTKINIYSVRHVVQMISYFLIRIILKLSTFYFRKQE
jgi:cardiolipin synthase